MQPVSAASVTISESRLDQVPREINGKVFEYLEHEIVNLELVNKLWTQKIPNAFWGKLAKKLNLEVTLDNAKQKVLDECRYRPVVEVFEAFLKTKSCSFLTNIEEKLQVGRNATEKYGIILNDMKELSGLGTITSFIKGVCQKDRKPTKKEIHAIRNFVKDDALQDNGKSLLEWPFLPSSLYQCILRKEKSNSHTKAMHFDQIGEYICKYSGVLGAKSLKILCAEGVFRPNKHNLFAAAISIKKISTEEEHKHLTVLLDYCDEEVRAGAIEGLQLSFQEDLKHRQLYQGDREQLDKQIEELFAHLIDLIKYAPPPTFGIRKAGEKQLTIL